MAQAPESGWPLYRRQDGWDLVGRGPVRNERASAAEPLIWTRVPGAAGVATSPGA